MVSTRQRNIYQFIKIYHMDLSYKFMIFARQRVPLITFPLVYVSLSFFFFDWPVYFISVYSVAAMGGGIKSNPCRRDYAITRLTLFRISSDAPRDILTSATWRTNYGI